jgi:hypothetical protein
MTMGARAVVTLADPPPSRREGFGGHQEAEAGIDVFSAGRGRNSMGIESAFLGRALREAKDEKILPGIGCAGLGQRFVFGGTRVTRGGNLRGELGNFSKGRIFGRPGHLEAPPEHAVAQLE